MGKEIDTKTGACEPQIDVGSRAVETLGEHRIKRIEQLLLWNVAEKLAPHATARHLDLPEEQT